MNKDTKFEPTNEEIYYEVHGNKHFVEDTVMAKLLVDGILFVGDYDSGPFFEAGDKEQDDDITACVWVNCNDLFAWGCADCESIRSKELIDLYELHIDPKNGTWGGSKWACKKRNMQPQAPVIEAMKKAGVWCDMMEGLPKNPDQTE